MDGLSAAASVIAVADVGAKLAFTLYQVADSYKTAAKDIQSVAKNTTLFASVLRDLGHTLERAHRNSNVRAGAYENCLDAIDECEGVFKDIQKGLKIDLGDKALNIDRLKRLKWFVVKPKVDLWQARLESLKATISVQIAVLNYGEMLKPVTPRTGSRDRQADWLALQAMIMAEKMAQTDYQKLLASQAYKDPASGSPSGKPARVSFVSSAVVPGRQKGMDFLDDDDSLTDQWPNDTKQLNSQSPKIQILDHSSDYLELWSELDVIEHAIRKVDLATWEAERLQDNLLVRSRQTDSRDRHDQEINKTRLKSLIKRFERRLVNAGFSNHDIDILVEHLRKDRVFYGLGDGRRHLVNLGGGKHAGFLRSASEIDTRPDMKVFDGSNTWRWMPDLLDDFLWAHTCNTLKIMPFKKRQLKLTGKTAAADEQGYRPLPHLSRQDSDERLRLGVEFDFKGRHHERKSQGSRSAKEAEAAKYMAERERESLQRKKQKEDKERNERVVVKRTGTAVHAYTSASSDSDEVQKKSSTRDDERRQLCRRRKAANRIYGDDEAHDSSDDLYDSSESYSEDGAAATVTVLKTHQEAQKFDPNWSIDRARQLINEYLYV